MIAILMKGGDAQMAVNRTVIEKVIPEDIQLDFISDEDETRNRNGRPSVSEDEEILTNGLSRRQWEWIKKEAKTKHIAAAQYQRFIVDCFIDSVEASRNGSPATRQDDHKYERLIKQENKSNKKTKSKSNKIKRSK